ncbi:hypothetical protein GGI07_005220 [Coemansia sp. Benny D115]|nr:hypothetical protein GGI07_005220 [Coemansia sp. Benny D115]
MFSEASSGSSSSNLDLFSSATTAATRGLAGGLRRPLGSIGSTASSISASLLYGTSTEEKVVLDIGSYTLRAGFSGDTAPLHKTPLHGGFTAVRPTGRLEGKAPAGLFENGIESEELLDALLLEQLREIYRRHLLLDSKSRKVAIVENALLPIQVKRSLARVLLGNLRVPQLTFYPSSVAALMTCGIMDGLVVDCGHRSTVVTPVYDGRPMLTYVISTPVGGHALFQNLRKLLLRFGRFTPFSTDAAASATGSPNEGNAQGGSSVAVSEDILSDEVVEFLKTKLLYVSPLSVPASFGTPPVGLGVGMVGDDLVEWFESSVTASSERTRMTIGGRPSGRARGVLEFPSWIRERASEILFYGDSVQDHRGIVDVLAQCIARVPVDTRRALAKKILMVGGVADMPNVRVRVLHDLVSRLRVDARWAVLADDLALAEEPGNGNEVSSANGATFPSSNRNWVGASLATAAKIGGVDVKPEDFDGYKLPDWTTTY